MVGREVRDGEQKFKESDVHDLTGDMTPSRRKIKRC